MRPESRTSRKPITETRALIIGLTIALGIMAGGFIEAGNNNQKK